MTSARKKAYLALIFCELIWGASQPLVKPALEFVSPSQFLFLRYAIASILVLPLIIKNLRLNRYSLIQWLKIIIIESISILNLLILYIALTHISALQSSIILQTRPIFVTLAGLIILNETIEKHEWVGLLFSVLGTFTILAKPFFFHPEGLISQSFIGTALLLISNLIYTANILLIKRHYKQVNKPAISAIHMWVGLIIFSVYLLLSNGLPNPYVVFSNPTVVWPLIYMAVFGSVIALTLSNFALSKIEASEATIFLYLQPLVYIPLSVFWLQEALSPAQMLGMTLILLGVVSSATKPKKKFLKHGIPLLHHLQFLKNESPNSQITRV